jgi:hypothetical protein
MTVRDFMNYLIYVEHSAENLQFYLWYKDYVRRFSEAKTVDISLAPEWTQTMEDDTIARLRRDHVDRMKPEPQAAKIFKGTDFEKPRSERRPTETSGSNPFSTPPRTPYRESSDRESDYAGSTPVSSVPASSYRSQAADAFHHAGAKQPCTCSAHVPVPKKSPKNSTLTPRLDSHYPAFP